MPIQAFSGRWGPIPGGGAELVPKGPFLTLLAPFGPRPRLDFPASDGEERGTGGGDEHGPIWQRVSLVLQGFLVQREVAIFGTFGSHQVAVKTRVWE